MSSARKVVAVVSALAVALGLGAVIHAGPAEISQNAAVPTVMTNAPMHPAPINPVSAGGIHAGSEHDLHAAIPGVQPDILPSKPLVPEAPCVIRTKATAKPGALVRLRVSAVCLPSSPVTIHHNGMTFTELTNAHGELDMVVPALAERALFLFTFAGEQVAMAVTHVPGTSAHDRVVLQWRGDEGFGMATSGNVVRLGNIQAEMPMMVEIHDFNAENSADALHRDLHVEVATTPRNCGREVRAQILQFGMDNRLRARKLSVSVPACTSVGDYVVLRDLFQDLRIAAR